MNDRPIRVLLADDEELIRTAIAALLALEPDLDVVAQAGDGRAAVDATVAHRPDVAVVDLEMPAPRRDRGGRRAGDGRAELRRGDPDRARPPATPAARAGRRAPGASCPKGAPGGALADVIRRVHGGARYVDPALAADALTARPCPLTPRELDVLRAAGLDTPVPAVARRVHLSQGTVRNHLAAIATKLGVPSRAEAYRTALDEGWLWEGPDQLRP